VEELSSRMCFAGFSLEHQQNTIQLLGPLSPPCRFLSTTPRLRALRCCCVLRAAGGAPTRRPDDPPAARHPSNDHLPGFWCRGWLQAKELCERVGVGYGAGEESALSSTISVRPALSGVGCCCILNTVRSTMIFP
jgi:hypothetical protein